MKYINLIIYLYSNTFTTLIMLRVRIKIWPFMSQNALKLDNTFNSVQMPIFSASYLHRFHDPSSLNWQIQLTQRIYKTKTKLRTHENLHHPLVEDRYHALFFLPYSLVATHTHPIWPSASFLLTSYFVNSWT